MVTRLVPRKLHVLAKELLRREEACSPRRDSEEKMIASTAVQVGSELRTVITFAEWRAGVDPASPIHAVPWRPGPSCFLAAKLRRVEASRH